jgi:hypothetical protein
MVISSSSAATLTCEMPNKLKPSNAGINVFVATTGGISLLSKKIG